MLLNIIYRLFILPREAVSYRPASAVFSEAAAIYTTALNPNPSGTLFKYYPFRFTLLRKPGNGSTNRNCQIGLSF